MARSKRVLIFTNAEFGQTQITFAILHELIQHKDVEIHVVSFPLLEKRISQFQQAYKPANFHFHAVKGQSHMEALTKILPVNKITHGTSLSQLQAAYKDWPTITAPWNSREYMSIVAQFVDILEDVKPDIVLKDPLLPMAKDAYVKAPHGLLATLNPLALQQVTGSMGVKFWRDPTAGSGIAYPVPWYLWPSNLWLFIYLVACAVLSSVHKPIDEARKRYGLTAPYPGYDKSGYQIMSALPETDYPSEIPPEVICCGPILLPCLEVAEIDPPLFSWLHRRPTVLISFGTHARSSPLQMRELLHGIRQLLDVRSDIQVLWKLKRGSDNHNTEEEPKTILKREFAEDRVRIVDWLDADPLAILQTGQVVCSVHHGGANSSYEALDTGVPQVVMGVWSDTYDWAAKIEWLGVGVFGNKHASSTGEWVLGSEFGQALKLVVGPSEQSTKMKMRAKELSETCRKAGGRRTAAAAILKLIETK